MLAFVTSLRARALAKDWIHITWLLERCLDSVLAQSSPSFRVYVACHERPEAKQANDPRLRFISMDLPIPKRTFEDMLIDKVLKISKGAEVAVKDGCDFLMYFDADDLVSRRLCSFVHDTPQSPDGWYFQKGYAYRHGARWLHRQQNHHMLCGTCNIVRSEALEFETQGYYRGERVERLAAAGHNKLIENLQSKGRVAQPLPFPGSVYIQHGDSTVTVQDHASAPDAKPTWRRLAGSIKHTLREALRSRPLTEALRSEFSILNPSDVPPQHRC